MAGSVDVAIITAKAEEYQAVYDLLQDSQLWPGTRKKPRRYSWTLGAIPQRSNNARYRVVLAVTHEQAGVSAALAAKETIDTFSPRYAVFVGIGGSLKDWISQGDLVVGNYVWGYEYGRMDETGNFVPRHLFTEALDNTLKSSVATFTQMQPDWWKTVGAKPGTIDAPPMVEFGGIASGDKVLESIESGFCQAIMKADPDLYAVDMEGHGTAQAVRQIREERPIGLMVVRGITDVPAGVTRSNTQPTDQTSGQIARISWTQYASKAAAAFVYTFISSHFPYAANASTPEAQQAKMVVPDAPPVSVASGIRIAEKRMMKPQTGDGGDEGAGDVDGSDTRSRKR